MKIFFDVDTQNDFMNKDGALYVSGAELIKLNLKLLTDYAVENKITVVGSRDVHFGTDEYRHRETELKQWGGQFPNHCIANSFGAETIPETRPRLYQNNHPHYLDESVREYLIDITIEEGFKCNLYFQKQSHDVFSNPAAELFLKKVGVKEAVVYGVATDYCVKAAVLGMQKRGIQCHVVEDAIKGITPEGEKKALEEIVKAGAKLTTTAEVLKGKCWQGGKK